MPDDDTTGFNMEQDAELQINMSLDRIEDRMNKIEDERLKRPIGEYLGCDVLDKDWSDIDSMILEKSHNDGVLQKVKYFIAENRKSR